MKATALGVLEEMCEGGCSQALCSLKQDCNKPCGSSQQGKAALPLGRAGAGADSTPAPDTGMEPVGMIWQHRVCRGNKLRQIIRETQMAWNGLDVQGNDPIPILPSTRSLEQLPHWDPKESCIFTQSAFFCVLGQWKRDQLLLELFLRWELSHSGAQMGSGQVFPYKQEKPCGFRIIWNVFLQNEDWLDAWSSPETMLIVLAACTPQEPIHKKKILIFKFIFFKTLCSWKKKLIE